MAKLTEAEMIARYDAERDGSAYVKPSTLLPAVADVTEGPEQLQITRHTIGADGSPAADPWTTYALGVAEIDIHDSGRGGNLCIPGLCHDFQDSAPLLDLALLLSNETVLEALDPTNDEYTPCSPAWEAVLDVICDPTDDGSAVESVPVPPAPAGYPTDRALIYRSYGETFIAIDRRDGEMVISEKDKPATEENTIIISPAYALALFRFFHEAPIKELMGYHWGQALRAGGCAELISLRDWMDAELSAAHTAPLKGAA
jgi:hypothetical protein